MRVHTDGRRKIARFNAPRSSAPALVTPIVDDDITYRRNATMRRKENDKVHTCSRGRSQGLYIDILKFNPYVIVAVLSFALCSLIHCVFLIAASVALPIECVFDTTNLSARAQWPVSAYQGVVGIQDAEILTNDAIGSIKPFFPYTNILHHWWLRCPPISRTLLGNTPWILIRQLSSHCVLMVSTVFCGI